MEIKSDFERRKKMYRKYRYYIACCDDNGKCIGYLKNDDSVSSDPDKDIDELMCFDTKPAASEKVMKANLSRLLMPSGIPYRTVAVRG